MNRARPTCHPQMIEKPAYGSPLSMLLIDIDGLKRINDERGHAAGDQILRGASEAIRQSLRGPD